MKKMLIDATEKESVRVAINKDGSLIDYESEKIINERIKGNIYLAKIVRVEPSLKQHLLIMEVQTWLSSL